MGAYMTKSAKLQEQAERCLAAAKRTKGQMRNVWLCHYNSIMAKLKSMSVKELSKEV